MQHIQRNKVFKKIFLGSDNKYFIRAQMKERQESTPDMREIRQKDYHLVFTYGTLQQGLWNHVFLRNATYLGKGRTCFERYEMFDAGFPVLHEAKPSEGSYVYGEVYAVDADTFMGLDYLESNGSMYHRKKIPIKLYQQDIEIDESGYNKVFPQKDCWTYFGDYQYWDGFKGLEEIQAARHYASHPMGLSFAHHHQKKKVG